MTREEKIANCKHYFIGWDSECFHCGATKWQLGIDPLAIDTHKPEERTHDNQD